VDVNEQFQVSRQLWAFLVESGRIPKPGAFIHATPHMSFVWGADNVAYLRQRHELLAAHPLFAGMLYSEDPTADRGVGAAAHGRTRRTTSLSPRRTPSRAATSTSARSPR
jgi:hypothetical protein